MTTAQTNQIPVYVGTYTRRDSALAHMEKGIQRFMFDPSSGALTFVETITGIVNPSFLAISPDRRFLYAVSEMTDLVNGRPAGGVAAYAIDPNSFTLRHLNEQATSGTSPCHLTVDATGRYVMATNYGSGSVCLFPIRPDGSLGNSSDFITHEGSSINPQRQQEPHPHSINLDPSNRFAFVPDLGTDKVMIYLLDTESGKLTLNAEQPWARTKSGAGPRHLAFHPNGKLLYVVNELDSTVTGFAFDADRGTLREIGAISTLPTDFDGKSHCADIHVHPNGKFLYASNRGHDSIAVFAVDAQSGDLKPVEYMPTGGQVPRNFAIEPTGTYLLAANQNSDDIFTFTIDDKNGKLTPTGLRTQVPAPVCIKFLTPA
jgi:6-phosphogluconolactonase